MDNAPPSLLSVLWQRKSTLIAALALIGIIAHLMLRYAFEGLLGARDLPLLLTLVIGGLPMLYDLLRKLQKRKFGSDLLGGVSIITSVVLGEYLAGSIIVLMLAGGEALESYALRSASSVLAALAKRMPSIAHRKTGADIADAGLEGTADFLQPEPCGFLLQFAQLGQTDGHGQRIAGKRSGLIDRPVRRKAVHNVSAPAKGPDRQPAAG